MNYHPDAATVAAREQMDIRAGYRRFARRALDMSQQREVGCSEELARTTPSEQPVTIDRPACSCPAPGR
jgi:hypothetical protein